MIVVMLDEPCSGWGPVWKVEFLSRVLSAPVPPFQMTFGFDNGYIGRLLARSLVRIELGTDPGGGGSGPVNS